MYPNELTNPAPANWPVRVNEALKSFRGYGLYAPNDLTTSGLTLGYFGGWLGATEISDGTVGALASSNTSYIVAHRTTGAVTHATNTTNWDDTTTYGRLFVAVTSGSAITSIRDWRLLTGGILGSVGGAVTSVNGQTGAVVTVPLTASPSFSATPTIDTSDKDVIYFGALTANVTAFNLSGTRAKVVVAFVQDGTGGRTVTAGSSIDFGTDIPDLSGVATGANVYTYVGFVYHPTTAKFRVVAISK